MLPNIESPILTSNPIRLPILAASGIQVQDSSSFNRTSQLLFSGTQAVQVEVECVARSGLTEVNGNGVVVVIYGKLLFYGSYIQML